MSIDKWTAVQRRFARLSTLYRAEKAHHMRTTGPDDWLVVDEREVVIVTVSPETYAAKTRAHLIAAAPEMYQLIENVAAAYEHDKSRHDLSATLYELRCKALQLLEKLEEGGTE